MIRFELKKIFERKFNVAAMVVGYILFGICLYQYIAQAEYYSEEPGEKVYGLEAIRMSKEHTDRQTDVVSETYMTSLIRDIQNQKMDLESDKAYTDLIRPLGDMFYFASKNYTDLQSEAIDVEALNKVDLSNGASFYEHRIQKVSDYLNRDFSYGNYSKAEKEYWMEKIENVTVPFVWGDKAVMDMAWDIIALGTYMIVVVIICISSVFSSEYETGAAPLLLTTKYGKSRLIWAKIITAFLFSILYVGIAVIGSLGIIAILLGFPGADLPIQLWNSVIPYDLTAMQVCLLNFGIVLLLTAAFTSILLSCSANIHSSFIVLVIGFLLFIVPTYFHMSKSSGLWNHIYCLFPVWVMNLKRMLGSFISYDFGIVLSYLCMTVLVYAFVIVFAFVPIKKGFLRIK